MSNPFTKRTRSKAVNTACTIAVNMYLKGYDHKTLTEFVKRFEIALCPEEFEEVK